MHNTVITTIFTEQYGEIDIKVIAEHPNQTVDFDSAEVYSLWNSADEPLGIFTSKKNELVYEGVDLAEDEQQQLADFIKAYRTGEWDL
jgi:hypothetical protein